MKQSKFNPDCSSATGFNLTAEQQFFLLEQTFAGISPFGIARRYPMKTLKRMTELINEAIEIKNEKK